MLMTNTRTHTGKSCMSIHASVCRSMTCYREDSFYRSITPECRREDYSRCCEGHVMFNDCCVSEYILYFNNVGYIRLVLLSEMEVLWLICAYERGSACRVSPKMLPIYWILGSIAIIMRSREDCYNISWTTEALSLDSNPTSQFSSND